MTNYPITEEDFDCSVGWIKDSVKAAKRLLKQKLCYKNDFLNVVCKPGYQCKRCEIIDACIQIDEGEDKNGK
jgi:hypothetical protein